MSHDCSFWKVLRFKCQNEAARYVYVPGSVISLTTALLCYKYCQMALLGCTVFVCTCASQHGCLCLHLCVCECASDHFPVIILCAFAMSNEALAVWRMLFNHANQHHAHSLQGYCSQCWTVSKADLLLADLLCPLPAAPVNDTTALMERLTGKEGGVKKDKEGVGTRVKERKNGTE